MVVKSKISTGELATGTEQRQLRGSVSGGIWGGKSVQVFLNYLIFLFRVAAHSNMGFLCATYAYMLITTKIPNGKF